MQHRKLGYSFAIDISPRAHKKRRDWILCQQGWPIRAHGAHIQYRDWLRHEQCSAMIGHSLLHLHVRNGSLTRRQQAT